MKTCSKCAVELTDKNAYRRKSGKEAGKQLANCKSCCLRIGMADYAKNREKRRASRRAQEEKNPKKFERQIKARYGISLEDWKQMFSEQGGVCAICKESRKLCVDHNHRSGKVRALLCNKCNWTLGLVGDSSETAQAVADFLKKHGN